MTLTQTVEIPANRRVHLDFVVPREVPEGKTDVTIQFPVREEAQPAAEEKPKMHIPKDSNGKFILTKEVMEEMEKNSPHTRALSGILAHLGDVDLEEVRMKRLAKHL